MNWRPAGRESYRRHIEWLKNDEWRHVSLSSRLNAAGKGAKFGMVADGRLWLLGAGKKNFGGIYISRFGVVLPAFNPDALETHGDGVLGILLRSRRDKLFSIVGMENRVKFVEALLHDEPVDVEHYRMFTGGLGTAPTASSDLKIIRASVNDLESLWPLERAYQIEEVIRNKNRINEHYARKLFLNTLKKQLVYYATLNGRPVAKAGTNARGWTFDQIGGVFVVPKYRNRGFAGEVMTVLLKSICNAGKGSCLFVKESNTAALRLYQGLGFQDRGPFRISYWS